MKEGLNQRAELIPSPGTYPSPGAWSTAERSQHGARCSPFLALHSSSRCAWGSGTPRSCPLHGAVNSAQPGRVLHTLPGQLWLRAAMPEPGQQCPESHPARAGKGVKLKLRLLPTFTPPHTPAFIFLQPQDYPSRIIPTKPAATPCFVFRSILVPRGSKKASEIQTLEASKGCRSDSLMMAEACLV